MKTPKFFIVDSPNCVLIDVAFRPHGFDFCEDSNDPSHNFTLEPAEGRAIAGNRWTDWGDFFCGHCVFNSKIRAQLANVKKLPLYHVPIELIDIQPFRLKKTHTPAYYGHKLPRRINTCRNLEGGEYSFTSLCPIPIPLLYHNREGNNFVFCDLRFVILARKYKWSDLQFRPSDSDYNIHNSVTSIDYLGKQWPPQWWPEGYEPHPSNVIEAEVPDVKVGEGLVGEFAPAEPPKPKRKAARADGPLFTPAAIRGLKLEEGDYGFEGEVSLSRPLYGADTLAVSISLEGDDMDEDGPRIKKSLLKAKAQAALTRLEPLLPQIHARLLEEGRPYAPTPEAFLETVHDPALLLTAADFTQVEKWSFVVESDIVGFHFEFDGDTLIDVWSGD